MGKKQDKSLKSAAPYSANSKAGDDSLTPEPYSCTGNFSDDFTELWHRSGLEKSYIPIVCHRGKPPNTPSTEDTKASPEGENDKTEDEPSTYVLVPNVEVFRPSVQVEFDIEDTRQMQLHHAREIFIRGWKLEEKVIGILKLCILDHLQCINLWNVGMTESTIKSLASLLQHLPNVKTLILDGNPIPESEPYYIFVAEETSLHHLSLRNNQITDKGAELLGKSLQNKKSQTQNLTTLNLSCNQISDKGANHIAQAMRMNRTLLSLSLASNYIGDEGCKALASILQRFPLTHEEIVRRRKLISQQGYFGRGSSAVGSRRTESKDRPNSNRSGSHVAAKGGRGSSKKKPDLKKTEAPEKTPKKEERGKKGDLSKQTTSKLAMTAETPKGQKGKKSGGGGKDGGKRAAAFNTSIDTEVIEPPEFISPLLDSQAEHSEGKVFISGCMTLVNLNLSRNKIGCSGMESLWNVVQYQLKNTSSSAPGLLKLKIHDNSFPMNHPMYLRMQEMMLTRDPSYKPDPNPVEDDAQSVMS